MNVARSILACLIYAVPAILLVDGTLTAGLVAIIVAAGLVTVAGTLRPGEAAFFVTVIRPAVLLALIPAAWMLLQLVPIRALAHPIWLSGEEALGTSIGGSISIDPGATLIAFGQYLCMASVAVLAAAIAVDRERAAWLLFALVIATTLVALLVIAHDAIGFAYLDETSTARAQARLCVALGIIVAAAALIRTAERYETGHARPERSPKVLMATIIACAAALALCVMALAFDLTAGRLLAVGYGVGTLAAIVAIRRLGLGLWGIAAIATVFAVAAVIAVGLRLAARPIDLTLALASKPDALIAATQRILADTPWAGTGAGTFAAMFTIYRDAGDAASATAPTGAAQIAIELGRPMLWAIVFILGSGIVLFLRGALQRGRDSCYAAAGASSLVLILLWMFCDPGLLGISAGLVVATIAGLALAQRKSRTVQ